MFLVLKSKEELKKIKEFRARELLNTSLRKRIHIRKDLVKNYEFNYAFLKTA